MRLKALTLSEEENMTFLDAGDQLAAFVGSALRNNTTLTVRHFCYCGNVLFSTKDVWLSKSHKATPAMKFSHGLFLCKKPTVELEDTHLP